MKTEIKRNFTPDTCDCTVDSYICMGNLSLVPGFCKCVDMHKCDRMCIWAWTESIYPIVLKELGNHSAFPLSVLLRIVLIHQRCLVTDKQQTLPNI